MDKSSRRLGVVLVAALATVGVALLWARRELNTPFAGWAGEAVVIEFPSGSGAGAIVARLGEEGVVRRPEVLRLWLRLRGQDAALHAGEYRFEKPASPLEVVERLGRGDVVLHPVTVPEGLPLSEVARRVARAGLGGEEALLEAFRDPEPILDLDAAATDLEGYLFPDTYRFPKNETEHRIARAMVQRFRETTGPGYPARAAEVGLSVREAVTLASLVEEETSLEEERGRISRVFHNRLERGMLLQCDPTVLYALRRAGRRVETLTLQDLQFDSPWNTYRSPGLPPGPISNPGRASLAAAVEPVAGRDLYFVASPEGGHDFSEDLAAHLRAVERWRRYVRSSR